MKKSHALLSRRQRGRSPCFPMIRLRNYKAHGFVLVDPMLDAGEVGAIANKAERLYATDAPWRVFEKDGETVRAVHGCHETSGVIGRLARDAHRLGPARQLLAVTLPPRVEDQRQTNAGRAQLEVAQGLHFLAPRGRNARARRGERRGADRQS